MMNQAYWSLGTLMNSTTVTSHQWASGWLLFHMNFSCSLQCDHNDKQITPTYLLLSSHHPFYNHQNQAWSIHQRLMVFLVHGRLKNGRQACMCSEHMLEWIRLVCLPFSLMCTRNTINLCWITYFCRLVCKGNKQGDLVCFERAFPVQQHGHMRNSSFVALLLSENKQNNKNRHVGSSPYFLSADWSV